MATLSNLQFIEAAPALAPDDVSPLLRRMQVMLFAIRPRSDAEALKFLRTRFPESSLSERLTALTHLRR